MTTPPLSQPARPPWAGLGRQPEPLELARWLVEVPEEERAEVLARLIHNAARGALCLEAAHDQFPETLHHQSATLARELEATATARAQATRYRLAWLSARRRAQQRADDLDLFADAPVPLGLALDETTGDVAWLPWDQGTADPMADLLRARHLTGLVDHPDEGKPWWSCRHTDETRWPRPVHLDGPCPDHAPMA